MGEVVERLERIRALGLWIHADNTSNLLDKRMLGRVMLNSILKDRVNCEGVLRSLPAGVEDVYKVEQAIVLDVLDNYLDAFDTKEYILLIAGVSETNNVKEVFDAMANECIGEEMLSLRDSQVFNKIGFAIQRKFTEVIVELMHIEEALLLVLQAIRREGK